MSTKYLSLQRGILSQYTEGNGQLNEVIRRWLCVSCEPDHEYHQPR